MSLRMTDEIQKNVLDPELKEWTMPNFSTTTECDQVVAANLMMGGLQKYFSYKMRFLCGLPSVALLGEREDWVKLTRKLGKITQLGSQCVKFVELLRPVLDHFVKTFDDPESGTVAHFWQRIAAEKPYGSGSEILTGWITAFCFWNEKGSCLYNLPVPGSDSRTRWAKPGCEIGEVQYHRVDSVEIPPGWASVPVMVDDNGDIFHTRMVAGSVGIEACSSRPGNDEEVDEPSAEEPSLDSIKPATGWWMFEVNRLEQAENETEESSSLARFVDGTQVDSTSPREYDNGGEDGIQTLLGRIKSQT